MDATKQARLADTVEVVTKLCQVKGRGFECVLEVRDGRVSKAPDPLSFWQGRRLDEVLELIEHYEWKWYDVTPVPNAEKAKVLVDSNPRTVDKIKEFFTARGMNIIDPALREIDEQVKAATCVPERMLKPQVPSAARMLELVEEARRLRIRDERGRDDMADALIYGGGPVYPRFAKLNVIRVTHFDRPTPSPFRNMGVGINGTGPFELNELSEERSFCAIVPVVREEGRVSDVLQPVPLKRPDHRSHQFSSPCALGLELTQAQAEALYYSLQSIIPVDRR